MRKRWTAAGMLVRRAAVATDHRRRDLAKLVIAIERHATVTPPKNLDRQEVAEPLPSDHHNIGLAAALDQPMTTVEGRVYRALRKLRDELE